MIRSRTICWAGAGGRSISRSRSRRISRSSRYTIALLFVRAVVVCIGAGGTRRTQEEEEQE